MGQAEIVEGLTGRDSQLGFDEVNIGDLLCDGVLHLDSRVHLDEHVAAGGVNEEFNRPGAAIANRACVGDCIGAQHRFYRCIQPRSRSDLNDFLEATLHRTVALMEVNHLTLGVPENLYLDVTDIAHRCLEKHRGIAESALALPHRGSNSVGKVFHPIHTPQAAPAAPSCSLDEQREPDCLGMIQRIRRAAQRWRLLQHRETSCLRRLPRPHLVPSEGQHVGSRANERETSLNTSFSKLRILRQESIARVDRVGTGVTTDANDFIDVQVGAHWMPANADLIRLVRLHPMEAVAVFVGVDRDSRDAKLCRRPEGPDGDLSTIGNKEFTNHARPSASSATTVKV